MQPPYVAVGADGQASGRVATWLNAGIPDKQQLLHESREMLLSSQTVDLLDQLSTQYPRDLAITFGMAMLSLAREGLDSKVFAALDDPGHVDAFLSELLSAGQPHQLRDTAELFLYLNLDDQALASAHLHLAIALVLTGNADDAPGKPGPLRTWTRTVSTGGSASRLSSSRPIPDSQP